MPYKTQLTVWQDDSNGDNEITPLMNRTKPDGSIHRVQIGKGGVSGLQKTLDELVRSQWTFSNITFVTHGGPGSISVGDDSDDYVAYDFQKKLGGRGYERLLPYGGVMVFLGCDVAMGRDGWDFLVAAGKTWLHGGGLVLGYRFKGWIYPGGEAVHYHRYNPLVINPLISDLIDNNAAKFIKFGRGGQVEQRFGSD